MSFVGTLGLLFKILVVSDLPMSHKMECSQMPQLLRHHFPPEGNGSLRKEKAPHQEVRTFQNAALHPEHRMPLPVLTLLPTLQLVQALSFIALMTAVGRGSFALCKM